MRKLFATVAATAAETVGPSPGDDLVPHPDVVMDRGLDLPGTPAQAWPWLLQLGKGRAGWYLPRTIERLVPPRRRAVRSVVPHWQSLVVGERIPDYGGPEEFFEAVELEPPGSSGGGHLVYRSERGRMQVSWAITLTPAGSGTRVHLRLRLAPVRRVWLAESVGELVDVLTVAGMAAGLRERLLGR